jgi:hypothetical protein
MLLTMIVGMVGKNLFLPTVSGIHCRADAGFVIQHIAADLRKRQISKNQEKEKERYPTMQVSSHC